MVYCAKSKTAKKRTWCKKTPCAVDSDNKSCILDGKTNRCRARISKKALPKKKSFKIIKKQKKTEEVAEVLPAPPLRRSARLNTAKGGAPPPKPMSKKASRAKVFNNKDLVTPGGLSTKDLVKSNGRIVSKVKSKIGKKNSWALAVKKARKELKIDGFAVIKKSEPIYDLAMKYYKGSVGGSGLKRHMLLKLGACTVLALGAIHNVMRRVWDSPLLKLCIKPCGTFLPVQTIPVRSIVTFKTVHGLFTEMLRKHEHTKLEFCKQWAFKLTTNDGGEENIESESSSTNDGVEENIEPESSPTIYKRDGPLGVEDWVADRRWIARRGRPGRAAVENYIEMEKSPTDLGLKEKWVVKPILASGPIPYAKKSDERATCDATIDAIPEREPILRRHFANDKDERLFDLKKIKDGPNFNFGGAPPLGEKQVTDESDASNTWSKIILLKKVAKTLVQNLREKTNDMKRAAEEFKRMFPANAAAGGGLVSVEAERDVQNFVQMIIEFSEMIEKLDTKNVFDHYDTTALNEDTLLQKINNVKELAKKLPEKTKQEIIERIEEMEKHSTKNM